MNGIEVMQLLTLIAAGDNRRVDDAAVAFWMGMVGDLQYDDCREAVREHFQDSGEYLMPHHVRQGALRRAEARGGAAIRAARADQERALIPRPAEGVLFGTQREPGVELVRYVLTAISAARAREGVLSPRRAGDVGEAAAKRWLAAHRPNGPEQVERLNSGCGRSGCPCTHGRDPRTGITCEGGWVEDTRPEGDPASNGAVSRCPTCAPERAKVLADAPTLAAAGRQLRAMTKPAER